MSIITSSGNPVFKSLLGAKKDRAMMFLEGRRLVQDALARGMVPQAAAVTPEYEESHGPVDFSHVVLDERLFARIADTKTPQGVLAFFPVPWASLEKIIEHEKIIILDGLQDPGNVGTIIRTAEAFGFSAVLVTEGTASPFSPKAVRASMGSSLGLDIARIREEDAKRLPHKIISLAPHGSLNLDREAFSGPTAICLGQEGTGVSREMLSLSHATVSIPMKGKVESLNVSIAAGIVMAYVSGIFSSSRPG
jgi:RNA methyltransferase, TrmH family